MKICKLIIKDFHQFKDLELDFTHPQTGEPLEKICFIGSNGTGKTKLLKLLDSSIEQHKKNDFKNFGFVFTKFKFGLNGYFWHILFKDRLKEIRFIRINNVINERDSNWIINFIRFIKEDIEGGINSYFPPESFLLPKSFRSTILLNESVVIDVPSEAETNPLINLVDVPLTTVNDSIAFSGYVNPYPYHIVSSDTVVNFWSILIYHLKKRENDFREFQNLEQNQNRTVREVKEEFDKKNPKILDSLAKLWDEILAKAGLEFDVANASNPIQLTDNLKAYIKLKATGERINYNDLSTGIRNFIFKIGHIYSLYFNRNINSGFLLVDEPENSLFPDFLYDIVSIYQRITKNTQIFMATHNPIVAAQFEPYERFILEFDEQGYVQARRGVVPVGDDPNDILSKDFGVRSLLGKEGVKKWERYIELRTMIPLIDDPIKKSELIDEFMTIGNEYNFANAVS